MKAAIYARYSSDLQNDTSIEDQVRNCRQYADRTGWIVLDGHIYCDRALSGKTMAGRTGLASLLKAASMKPRPFDYILIDDTSRLSREKIEQAQIVRDLRDIGIYIYFVSDNIDTQDETAEDVILPIYGIKDSLYSRDLANKTKRGMAGQVLKGFNPGGRTYGYKYTALPDPSGTIDRKTRQVKSLGTQIEIDQNQARIVKTIFSMYASGYGLKAIASHLNAQNIEPPGKDRQLKRGNTSPSWCPNAIRSMLQNPKYIGDWTWNKFKWIRVRKTGKRKYIQRPKDEWVEYTNPDLAICDDALWESVQKRFKKNKSIYSSGARSPRKNHLTSGLLRCKICGANLILVKCKGGDNLGYRCSFNWHRGSKVCPNNVTIRKVDIENQVLNALQDRILNPDIIELVVHKVNAIIKNRLGQAQEERKRLTQTIVNITREIQTLLKLITESGTILPTVQKTIEEKERALATVESELSELEAQTTVNELKVDPKFVTKWFKNLKQLVKNDILAARAEIGNIIGELSGTPIEIDGQKALRITGKPKIEGVLGIIPGASTLMNSGGRI